MKPRYDTFGENLFWSYANWQMIFATAQYGVEKFDRRSYMIRQGCYKKLCDGSRHISDLYKMNQTKVKAGNYCFYCHTEMPKEQLTLDHVFPRVKGGENEIDNIIFVCKSCNSSKGKRDLIEWFLLYRNEFPSPFVLGHYLRQVYDYVTKNNLMGLRFENVCEIDTPFEPRGILLPLQPQAATHYLSMIKNFKGGDYDWY